MAGKNAGSVYIDVGLNLGDIAAGISKLEGNVAGLEKVFAGLHDSIVKNFSAAEFAPVMGAFVEMGETLAPVDKELLGVVAGFAELLHKIPRTTAAVFDNVEAATAAATVYAGLTERIWGQNAAQKALNATFLSTPLGKMIGLVKELDGGIGRLGESSGLFGDLWGGIWEGVWTTASAAWISLSGLFGTEIPTAWGGMLSGIEKGWSSTWKAIGNVLTGAMNRVVDGINTVIEGMNRIHVDIPEWLGGGKFGFNVPLLGRVPMLAKGGIVDSPTLAMVGERGREAVLPLENNTGWMVDLANSVGDAVAASMAMGRNGSGGGTVVLHIDGKKMAEALVDDLNEAAARRGVNMALGKA